MEFQDLIKKGATGQAFVKRSKWRRCAATPQEVLCPTCLENFKVGGHPSDDCHTCFGTFLAPIPFSEIWGRDVQTT